MNCASCKHRQVCKYYENYMEALRVFEMSVTKATGFRCGDKSYELDHTSLRMGTDYITKRCNKYDKQGQ